MSGVIDVAKRVALRQKGGISGMAERIGVNANTLTNKLAEQSGHNLFATELEAMVLDAQAPEIAQYFAGLCNHVVIPVAPLFANHGDLSTEIVAVGREFGDLMQATQEAIKDGRVTARELANYERQFMELIAAAVALRVELKKRIPAPPSELKVAK